MGVPSGLFSQIYSLYHDSSNYFFDLLPGSHKGSFHFKKSWLPSNESVIANTVFKYWNPSKHLLVLKTSSTRLQLNKLRLSRRLEDVLKMSWRHLARRLGRRKTVTLKTSWRHALKMSWIISLFILLWNSSSISILRIKISGDWFGFVKSAEKMRQ